MMRPSVREPMKGLIIFIAFLFYTPVAFAQQPTFADLAWGSSIAATAKQLKVKGFSTKVDSDGDLRFEGTLLSHRCVGFAVFGNEKLLKVQVAIATPDHKARGVYSDLRETLINKYGEATDTFEFFLDPYYDGDGYEEQAIRVGKGHFATYWGSALSIEITEKLAVRLSYESPGWEAESERRKNKARNVF